VQLNEQDIEHPAGLRRNEFDGLFLGIIQVADRDLRRPVLRRYKPVVCWICAVIALRWLRIPDRFGSPRWARRIGCQPWIYALCRRLDLNTTYAGSGSILEIAYGNCDWQEHSQEKDHDDDDISPLMWGTVQRFVYSRFSMADRLIVQSQVRKITAVIIKYIKDTSIAG